MTRSEPCHDTTRVGPQTASLDNESSAHRRLDAASPSPRGRTAENSAAFLLPHLDPDMVLLDVGCGSGTVTADLAARLTHGSVVGVDASAAALARARELAADRGCENLSFDQATAYDLPYADGTFDVVYAHQLLQHLDNPVAALREMRRVTVPGGVVAVRDADYGAMSWYPLSPGLAEWNALYHEVSQTHGAQPDAGRHLLSWVRSAGFEPTGVFPSASVWCYATRDDRAWWGDLWAQRCTESNFAAQAKAAGLADEVGLEELAQEWRQWTLSPDGWFSVVHGEVLARA